MDDRKTFETGSFRDRPVGRGMYAHMPPCALKRLAQRYEYGFLKYGDPEMYKLGYPITDTLDSLMRHVVAYMEGDNSEDHLAAIAWNAFCLMHTEENVPKCQDIAARKKLSKAKGDFNYLEKAIQEGVLK